MAVVPMQKVHLLVHRNDVDAALDIIQRSDALEFQAVDASDTDVPSLIFPHADLLTRVQHAVHFLDEYAPKVTLWRTLRDGSQYELTEKDVSRHLTDTDVAESVVTDLESLQVEFADKNEVVRRLEEDFSALTEWVDLPFSLRELETSRTVTFLLKNVQASDKKPLGQSVSEFCQTESIPLCLTDVSSKMVAVTLEKTAAVSIIGRQIADAVSAEAVVLPTGKETIDVELLAVTDKLAKARGEVALSLDQAEHFAITHLRTLREVSEVLSWQHDRYEVMADASMTQFTVTFKGWLREDIRNEIENSFSKRKIAAVFSELDTDEDEQTPVEIVNSKFVQPFEIVTRLYGMPGYKDLDPTVFLAGFFFLFFGLSLTDVGYGLSLMVVSASILLFFKVTDATRLFAKLLLLIGFSTVLVGMLFGGYLGFEPTFLPQWMQSLQAFDPIGDPLPVFYLALSLGVFQVMVGMMLSIYSEYRNKRLIAGIIDQGPWLFLFVIGIIYVLTSISYIEWLTIDQISNLSLVGVVLIALAGASKGKGILQKIMSSFLGLYAGVAHFSDILSYSRLLALGLATSALAYAVNLIALMLNDVPYVGFLLSGIILFIGHSFTLVINTLGAFVHSARLQFVEFFGKFITGTGKEFAPLSRKEKYITIRDD